MKQTQINPWFNSRSRPFKKHRYMGYEIPCIWDENISSLMDDLIWAKFQHAKDRFDLLYDRLVIKQDDPWKHLTDYIPEEFVFAAGYDDNDLNAIKALNQRFYEVFITAHSLYSVKKLLDPLCFWKVYWKLYICRKILTRMEQMACNYIIRRDNYSHGSWDNYVSDVLSE